MRFARSIAAVGHGRKHAQVGKADPVKQSKVWFSERSALGGQPAAPPEVLQELSWKQFFKDTAQWWDNRRSKPTPRHPDFRHKDSNFPLWLNNRHKPVWVDSLLAAMDAGLVKTVETGSTRAEGTGPFLAAESFMEVEMSFKLCQAGKVHEAVDALDVLVQRGCSVSSHMFFLVLKKCIQVKDLALGKRIHGLTVRCGYEENAYLATHLIVMYASHSSLEEAMEVFTKVPTPNSHNWSTIISAHARHGEAVKAIRLYRQMRELSTIEPNNHLYSAVLRACSAAKDLITGKEVHAHILASSGKPDTIVQAGLINMYAKCGCLQDARRLFNKAADRNVVTWTAMIAGYAQHRLGLEALSLYSSMRQHGLSPNSVTFICLLQACASVGVGALNEGKNLHAQIKERGMQDDAVLGGSLVNMYAKCGGLEDARKLFDKLPRRNIVGWNTMIAGYSQQGMCEEALSLYSSMQLAGLSPNLVTFVCLLQACSGAGSSALHLGKKLHAQIEERGLHDNAVLGGSLVNMYVKCGRLQDARIVFDKLSDKNVVVWTAMIAGYVQQGVGLEALTLYSAMQANGLVPNSVTYASLLQACASIGVAALHEGKQLHARTREHGFEDDMVVGSSLVNMYAKCGGLEDGRQLLGRLREKSVVAWTAMIAGYSQRAMGQEALSLHASMQQEGVSPDSVTYVCLLQACASIGTGALDKGKQLHAEIEQRGLEVDAVLGSSLVDMYVKCGSLEDARRIFDKLLKRNVVAWTAMIGGFAQQGMGHEALMLYHSMQQEGITPNSVTYVCLLQACASVGVTALPQGKQLHAEVEGQNLEEDRVVGSSLINMYVKCGSLGDAQKLFDRLSDRSAVAWTAMVAGYAQQGMCEEALKLYHSMQEEGLTPDSVVYVSLLRACAAVGVGALHDGKQLHAQIKERGLEGDLVLGGSLLNMYVKCGGLNDARKLFDTLPNKNLVEWTAMIGGYAQQGMGQEALGLYSSMQQHGYIPNSVTFVCLLQACAAIGVDALDVGKQLHVQIGQIGLEGEVALGGSLVNMYAKCGSLEDARRLFDKLPNRNVLEWTTMMTGYAQQGMGQEVLSLYSRMQQEGFTPDPVTYVSVLQACAAVSALPLGQQLHAEILEGGAQVDGSVGVALVDMYAKCGSMSDAQRVFDVMSRRSTEAWNALIGGYAHQGDSQIVFDLLVEMRSESIHPDEITFLIVLTVCSHVGLVDKGREYFDAMSSEYGISATLDHYICMVDLLGRAGHLHEALEMVREMPFSPNDVMWLTLLGACRKWKNVEIGRQAFNGAVSVDEKGAAAYALMFNIYAGNQMWDAAQGVKARTKELGAWKKPGQSWSTDIGGVMHTFIAQNIKHRGGESSHTIYSGWNSSCA